MMLALLTAAYLQTFGPGAVLPEHGEVAPIDATFEAPAEQAFKVVFDIVRTAEEGESPHIGKVARFLNMHGDGGLDPRPLDIVVVIHGRAVGDMVDEENNAQRAMVQALLRHNIRFVVCGQSMAGLEVPQDQLIQGVEVALSAMTAHASLMTDGYHSMPF